MTVQQAVHPERRIVVGVDGSPCSEAALRWAIDQARATGSAIEAVASWQDPLGSGFSFGFTPVVTVDADWAALAGKALADSVGTAASEGGAPVTIVQRVVEGHPAQVLLDAARGAGLLVVGSRGHGRVAGMLLGSVSQHCVLHAPCPVVVVPESA